MKEKIKVHYVRKVYGPGGGKISGDIFERLLADYVDLVDINQAQVIHNYDGPLNLYKKPSVFVVNSWKYSCPACIQTTTYNQDICTRGSLFKCMRCYYHNEKSVNKKAIMGSVAPLYYFKNRYRMSRLREQKTIVSISNALKEILEKNNINVTKAIYDPLDPVILKEKKDEDKKEKFFFHHGNLDWIHGVSLLIKSRSYSKYPLKIVGWGLYSNKLKETDIEYLGVINDPIKIGDLISSSYAYIYPCLHNNFGRSLIEAMALGKPIITINRGFSKEVIENWKNGILINPNAKELNDAMQYLWDNEKEAKLLGINARKTAIEKFHPDVVFSQYIKLYENMID